MGGTVAIVLLCLFLVFGFCVWLVSWDWADREKPYHYVEPLLYCDDKTRQCGKYRDSVYGVGQVTCP